MAASDARPMPKYATAYRVTFPIFNATGDLVADAAGLDSEVSLDGGTFADCTNEATQIASSSGMYYLDLTSSEMTARTVTVIIKTSTTGAKTTPIVLYPVQSGDIEAAVSNDAIADVVDGVLNAMRDDYTAEGSIGEAIGQAADAGTGPHIEQIQFLWERFKRTKATDTSSSVIMDEDGVTPKWVQAITTTESTITHGEWELVE